MVEDLFAILVRFHREVVLPDLERVFGELRLEQNERFAGLDGHFNAIHKRFDKLESQCHMLAAGLKRVEEHLDRVEQRLDAIEKKLEKLALRSELVRR